MFVRLQRTLPRASSAVAIAFITILAASSAALANLTMIGSSSASFKATASAGMVETGKTLAHSVKVVDNGTTLTVTAALKGLSTGAPIRDKSILQSLAVGEYPTAAVSVPKAKLKQPAPGAEVKGTAPASMTLRGKTRPVTISYVAKNVSGTITFDWHTTVNVDGFGISRPSVLGISVRPNVTISTQFEMTGS